MKTKTNLTMNEFRAMLEKCDGKVVALDTETTGLRWWEDKVTTVGFHCPDAGVEGTIDIGTSPPSDEPHPKLKGKRKNYSKARLEKSREEWLNSNELNEFHMMVCMIVQGTLGPGTTVIMHNSKFDAGMLQIDAEDMNGWNIIDTPTMVHLYDSRMLKNLGNCERKLLGSNSKRKHIEEAPAAKMLKNRVWFWPHQTRQDYCLNDVRVTYQLAEALTPQLRKLGLEQLFLKDMKYIKLLYHTEHVGIFLDQDFVKRSLIPLNAHTKELEVKLLDSIGYEFNWRSPKQLSQALYEGCGIPMPKSPYGQRSSVTSFTNDMGVKRVTKLKGDEYNSTCTSTRLLMEVVKHPLGELVSSLRESAKLAKVCLQWLRLVDKNSIIHTNYNITGTRTGRLSSSQPNMANVPSEVRSRFTQGLYSGGLIRKDEYNLRNAFCARPGNYMLSIDYAQQEMRMFAYISQDKNLMQYVQEGKDIHLMIALKVWGECGKAQNKIHREWSKTIAFGLLYGMTGGSLQHKLGMSQTQATKIIDDYWTAFPRIRPTLHETVAHCLKHHMIRYWSGRIWREESEMHMYKGVNAQVQGGCADLLSIAALRVQEYFRENNRGRIVGYVYDELLMEVEKYTAENSATEVAAIMQIPDVLNLPFLTDCKIGTTYGNLIAMVKTGETYTFSDEFKETFLNEQIKEIAG